MSLLALSNINNLLKSKLSPYAYSITSESFEDVEIPVLTPSIESLYDFNSYKEKYSQNKTKAFLDTDSVYETLESQEELEFQEEDYIESLKGVHVVEMPKKVLFTMNVDLKRLELKKRTPHIVIDDIFFEDDDE